MTFIIAECGVNWRCLSEADQMIKEAAKAGANAAKFQAYKPEFTPFQTPYSKHLNRIALKEEDIRYLYYRCQQHGIEFMCTPMYPEAVEMLDPYVKRWKVRFKDRGNGDLLKTIRATKKQILLSSDIAHEKPVGIYNYLYCVPEYPPAMYPSDKDFFGFDGYSCHIPDYKHLTGFSLDYLEVHVRLDTYTPAWEPPDQRVSITMSELRELCKELGK